MADDLTTPVGPSVADHPEELVGTAVHLFLDGETSPGQARRSRRWLPSRAGILGTQVLILAIVLGAWQWLPKVGALRRWSHLFDRFFVSSPSEVAQRVGKLLFHTPSTWTLIGHTVGASMIGLIIGLVLGGAGGLVIASSHRLAAVFHPFAVAINAVPRIALVPIVVVIWGPSFSSSIIISVLVVFFIAFFNAFEGARSVRPALIHNARIMGAGGLQITRRIRGPYALAWTLASLPLSATFSVIAVVTGEVLTGYAGVGSLLTSASANVDATLTFAVVVILSVIGLLVVALAEIFRRRVLHWWGKGE